MIQTDLNGNSSLLKIITEPHVCMRLQEEQPRRTKRGMWKKERTERRVRRGHSTPLTSSKMTTASLRLMPITSRTPGSTCSRAREIHMTAVHVRPVYGCLPTRNPAGSHLVLMIDPTHPHELARKRVGRLKCSSREFQCLPENGPRT